MAFPVTSGTRGSDGRVQFGAVSYIRMGCRLLKGHRPIDTLRKPLIQAGSSRMAERRCPSRRGDSDHEDNCYAGLLAFVLSAISCGTVTGAAVGAGAGAAIGEGTGHGARKGALIGTGVGAAAGAIYDITK